MRPLCSLRLRTLFEASLVEKITRIGNTAVHLAQEENRRKGIPNVYCINGRIIWQLPDGTVTMQDPLEGITPDAKGRAVLESLV